MSPSPLRLAVFSGLCLHVAASSYGLQNREANTSLALPEEPLALEYEVENAFPGLSFYQPVALATPAGDNSRVFVVEQSGRIYVINDVSSPTKSLFLDYSSIVSSAGEGGLLGLAFHPDWQSNGYFFVFYTLQTSSSAGSGLHDRVSRFEIDPTDPNKALTGSEQPLITQYDEAGNHNAGDLHFGPDGYLYISTGDEGGGGDSFNNSRFIDKDFFSAILRIDVDKMAGNLEPNDHPAIHKNGSSLAYYSVPNDNPFVGATSFDGQAINPSNVRTEFYAVGLRNPWRFTFDSVTGVLICADVGQNAWEEVNIIESGGDYGWKYREGLHPYSGTVPAGITLTDPILEYPHSNGPAIPGGVAQGISITGGVVYRGNTISQLSGYYVFGDFGGRIFAFRYNGSTGQAEDFQQLTSVSQPAAFGHDPSNGDVLISSRAGTIYRLTHTPVSGLPIPDELSKTGAFSDLQTLEPYSGIVPFEINVPFWSDHAIKSRWFSVPSISDTITFSSSENWGFPIGTVWIKHFDIEIINGDPGSRRRLETRFLVKNSDGIHGFTYRWNQSETDADLVDESGLDENITIYETDGVTVLREQTWRYPSRSECIQCHTSQGGHALGFNTLQLNREYDYGSGHVNQISALSQVGYFDSSVGDPSSMPALPDTSDSSFSLEERVRSYLQANCVQCHQPGGPSQGNWDASFLVDLDSANLINGELVDNGGDPSNKVIVPGDPAHSMLLQRISIRGAQQMPPLGSNEVDAEGVQLLSDWIAFLGSPPAEAEVSWAQPSSITYGTPLSAVQLNATANVSGSFVYSPASGTVLNAGSNQQLNVTFTPDDLSAYSVVIASTSIDVNPAQLTLTADDKQRTYGDLNPTLTFSASGFQNGDNINDLDTQPSLSTAAVQSSPSGLYSISIAGASNSNYSISHVAGQQEITPAPLTISANDASRIYGQSNPPFSLNYAGFKLGETFSVLDVQADVSTTAGPSSPAGSYSIVPSGASDSNYSISYQNGILNVNKASLTLASNDAQRSYGDSNPAFTFNASGLVAGDAISDLDTQPQITTTATSSSLPGSYPLTISEASDSNYNISHVSSGSLVVIPSILTISADNKFKVEGSANPGLTATYSGLKLGQQPADLSIQVSLSTSADQSSPPGEYAINASGAADVRYDITHQPGILTVTAQGVVVLTVEDKIRSYGSDNPELTFTATGFAPGDSIQDLDTQPIIQTAANASSPVGQYQISISGASDSEYAIIHQNGMLTVSLATLTVTADDKSKEVGQPNPELTASYNGFALGEGPEILDTAPSLTTSANESSGVGTYEISVSGASADNYNMNFVPGQLTVVAAPSGGGSGGGSGGSGGGGGGSSKPIVTLTADSLTKPYGSPNPPLTFSVEGLKEGDSVDDFLLTPRLRVSANELSLPGEYPITITGAFDLDYTVNHVNGTLLVTPAILIFKADDKSKQLGESNPELTSSVQGLVLGHDARDVKASATLSTEVDESTPPGVYDILLVDGLDNDDRYEVIFENAHLTVLSNSKVGKVDFGTDGTASITFTGTSLTAYRLEISNDMKTWEKIGMLVTDNEGDGQFEGINIADLAQSQFYRIIED